MNNPNLPANNENHNWSFPMNVAGVEAWSGGGGGAMEENYNKAVITAAYLKEPTSKSVTLKLEVAEGDYKGRKMVRWLKIPTSPDDKVRHYWRAAFESAGYTATELDAGDFTCKPDLLLGRVAHVHFVPAEDEDGFHDVNMIPPHEWVQRAQAFLANKGGQAAPAGAAGSALGGGGGGMGAGQAGGIGGGNAGVNALGGGGAQAGTIGANAVSALLGQ